MVANGRSDGSGVHRVLQLAASDEESDGFVQPALAPSNGVEQQLRSVRLMSLASVFLGLVSVAAMAAVVAAPADPLREGSSQNAVIGLSALPQTESSARGWYRSYLDSQIRTGESLDSEKVKVLYADSLVYIAEVRGRRARVLRPVAGWMSMQTADGVEILRPDMTYRATPDKADIQAVFRSRKVREATARLQASAEKLTKVEKQLMDALERFKKVPQHVEAKLKKEWPQMVKQAPKTGEHVAKHTINAFHKIVKPQGTQSIVNRAAQNEHIQNIQTALNSKKVGDLLERAKHEVSEVHRAQKEAGSFKASLRGSPSMVAV